MKVLYKEKQDEVVAFEDLEMGDFFKADNGVFLVIFQNNVVIIDHQSYHTGDTYTGDAINNKFKGRRVTKLDVHLVVNS